MLFKTLVFCFPSHQHVPMDISVSKNFPGQYPETLNGGSYHSHAHPNQDLLYYVETSMHCEHNLFTDLHIIHAQPKQA